MSTPPAPQTSLCDYLEWDSAFFGLRIARVRERTLTPEGMSVVLNWCDAERIDCLYFLADQYDALPIRLAEDGGFRLVDLRVTLDARVDPESRGEPGQLREVRDEDVSALKAMAKTGFGLSRFFFDPGFPRSRAESLYEVWIEKSCLGAADAVLVADDSSGPVGYVTCHVQADSSGQIGLLGVRDDCQGRGIGRRLVSGALQWCAHRGVTQVRVVTQGRNRGALRVYGLNGFIVDSVELWYHRWFQDAPGRDPKR